MAYVFSRSVPLSVHSKSPFTVFSFLENIPGLPLVVGNEYVYERPTGTYSHAAGKAKCESMGMRLPVINDVVEYDAFKIARYVLASVLRALFSKV